MADQPDYSGSAMLALYPPPALAGRLAVPGGLDPAEMHVTVAYVGDAADVDPDALCTAAAMLSARQPVEAVIAGHARFTGGEQDVIVALADSPGLESLRADALRVLAGQGIAVPSGHGYAAHCTIQYLGQDDPDPVGRVPSVPVTFGAISAVHGTDRTDYLLELPAPAGGPAAERAPGRAAAGVTEATLKLGALKGAWAAVYKRQDDLYALSAVGVLAAWRKLLRDLDITLMVGALRRQAGMTDDGTPAPGTDSDSAASAKYHKAELKTLALTLATGMLAALPGLPLFGGFVADIDSALGLAAAEGFAAALAVAASEAGYAQFDWAAAEQDGQKLAAPEGSADTVAAAIIAGCATDLAVTLTGMAVAGATAAAMARFVSDYLRDPKALTAYLQHAMGTSLAAAWLAVYDSAQVERILWVTAGDDRVCAICDGYEDENPWAPETFPHMPAHVKCRCSPLSEGTDSVRFDMYAAYITQRRAA